MPTRNTAPTSPALQPYLGANQSAVGGEAGLYSGLGTGLAGLYGQQGQAAQATQTGIGNANADAALADYNASRNIWTTVLGVVQAGLSCAGCRRPCRKWRRPERSQHSA